LSLAFLFPGQGSRGLLAGLDLAASTPAGQALLDRACAAADVPCARLRDRGGRALERTEVLQPVLTAVALAAHGALVDTGIAPAFVLGHSLGEIAAWSAAGCISAGDAVDVAALRGKLMAREALLHPGGMLAIAGGEDAAAKALALAGAKGAEIAAWNAPDEVVFAGPEEALSAIAATLPSRRLAVAGAWHGASMAGAVEDLRAALCRVPRRAPTARILGGDGDEPARHDDIPDLLAGQLVRPVRFGRALAYAWAEGVRVFVTAGPGVVLRALVRKNLGAEARVHTTEDAADLARTITSLGSPS
jgi:[acyl-carrier-protein] S-malonyltransferase